MTRYIFIRIAWMKNYQGVTDYDIPAGAGSYVEENQDGGEVYNFYPIGSKYYGYGRVQRNKSIHLEKLGASKDDKFLDGVTIIFFARNKPLGGGQYIVGWYKSARLYREVQQLNKSIKYRRYFNSICEIGEAYLVPEDDRTVFRVPEDGPGQSNLWYVENYHKKKYLEDVKEYINNPQNYIRRLPKRKGGGLPWQKDAELKKKVELAAMEAVAKYFKLRMFTVVYRHEENLGWDLEAHLDNKTLLLEVKGLSGPFNIIEFTSNEYQNSKTNKKHYRICVVEHALNPIHQKIYIYYFDKRGWICEDGSTLKTVEVISARFEKVHKK